METREQVLKKASGAVRGECLLSRGRGMCETEQGGKTNEGSTWGGDMAKGRGVRKIRSSLCKVSSWQDRPGVSFAVRGFF